MDMPGPPTFWRSPRLTPDLPRETIEIPAPPQEPNAPGALLSMLISAGFTAGVMVAVALATGMSNWILFSVPMLLASSVASVITSVVQKRNHRRQLRERQEKYRALLREYERRLEEARRAQRRILLKDNPQPKRCLERIRALQRDLWVRTPEHDDFLDLRLGLGCLVSTVKIKVPEARDILSPDPLLEAARELAERFAFVADVPVMLPVRKAGVTGVAGPRWAVLNAARALMTQLATHHSPDKTRIAVIYPHEETEQWRWIRWLPHIWDKNRTQRFLADGEQGVHKMLSSIEQVLDRRKAMVVDWHDSGAAPFPYHMVVFLADPALTEQQALIQRLQAEGPSLGFYPVFLRDKVRSLPADCRAIVKLDGNRSFLTLIEPIKRSYPFLPDKAEESQVEQFARAMAPIRLESMASADIPPLVPLLDLLNATKVEDLRVLDRWRDSETASRSLAVPIGLRAGGEALMLDLHERAHGPNGLVAGMVGAGKSELLQTLVACLAVRFHPHRLAFVLVDYKGGGMADPFVNLPHTLGVITNLQKGNLAIRALTSFKVEAERRQRLFAEAGVNHIDAYQRLYYDGRLKVPLPYLVIIVDEFAEMKTEQPEVAKEFVRIARLGRALGFRLVLAMQKPAGIVDGQIEANTRFRLCLRVAQTEDSQAMLKRADAAYMTGTGRAYLQVGANEVFELFQVAWGGAPYDPEEAAAKSLEIVEISLDGGRKTLYRPGSQRSGHEVTQLQALVKHLGQVAQVSGIERLQGLWHPPLPEYLPLEDLRPEEGWNGTLWKPPEQWVAPVVGLADNPRQQRQDPLRVDLGHEGHLLVYGAPGSGKTTFVQTLVASLALTYCPNDVHMYLLDFGGRLLKMFESLPHVGSVIVPDESERLHRLLWYLLKEIDRRKELFGKAGVTTLEAYRTVADNALPAIVTIVDNFANLVGAYEEKEEAFVQIAREGGTLGVHLVLTANSSADVRFRISSNITMAIALQLVEQGEYGAIVGRTENLVPAPVPGRGLIRGTPPLEFQTALPAGGDTDAGRTMALRQLIAGVAEMWQGGRAPSVPVLPDVVYLGDVVLRLSEPASDETSSIDLTVPVGLDVSELVPAHIDLQSGPNFLIVGAVQTGKTTLLQTWLLALAEKLSPERVYMFVLDSQRRGLSSLGGLPQVKAYACRPEESDVVLQNLQEIVEERYKMLDRARCAPKGSGGDTGMSPPWPVLVVAIDDILDPFYDGTSEKGKQTLTALLRRGRSLRLYVLVAGSTNDMSSKGWSEPIKTLRGTQTGFVLGSSDDAVLDLRLPYAERNKPLPLGEGYWTRRGLSRRVKFAIPARRDVCLQEWVERIAARYGGVSKETKGDDVVA